MGSVVLGVLADTHIPDRSENLHPNIIQIFQEHEVQAVLHAGDICAPRVLTQLSTLAPVYAVRGNRDIFLLRNLPLKIEFTFNKVPIGLTHGHGRLIDYLVDRVRYTFGDLNWHHFYRRALSTFPQSKVIVFGHIHRPTCLWIQDKLLFNPGSASCPDNYNGPPTVGLLHLFPNGEVKGEIFPLE